MIKDLVIPSIATSRPMLITVKSKSRLQVKCQGPGIARGLDALIMVLAWPTIGRGDPNIYVAACLATNRTRIKRSLVDLGMARIRPASYKHQGPQDTCEVLGHMGPRFKYLSHPPLGTRTCAYGRYALPILKPKVEPC